MMAAYFKGIIMINASESKARKWIILLSVCIGAFSISFNTTAIMNAIPVIRHDLHLSISSTEWAINAYMLGSATLILIGGKLGDIFPRRIIFYIGGTIFILASILVALADSGSGLILGRAIQGLGVAFFIPTTLSIAKINFPEPGEQKMAIGIWSGMVSLGFSAGPLVSGVLIDALSWRFIFWVNIPIILIAFAIIFFCKTKPPIASPVKPKIDYLGNVFLIIAVFCLCFGLTEGNAWGWANIWIWTFILVSVVAFAIFYKIEHIVEQPTVHFNLFENKIYLLGTILIFLTFYGLINIMYFYNLFIQNQALLGLTPLWAGLSLLPTTVAIFILSFITPKLNVRYGYRHLSALAFLFLFAGFLWLAFISHNTSYAILWIPLLLIGIGMGGTFPCFSGMALSQLPAKASGEGSGIISINMYFTAIVGTSIGSIFYLNSSYHVLIKGFSHLDGISKTLAISVAENITNVSIPLHRAIEAVPAHLQASVAALAQQAGIAAFNNAMLAVAVLSFIGMALCICFIPNKL